MPMKALILSCGTGGGHNEAGKAVCEALRLRGHEAVFFKDYLRLAGKRTDQVVCNLYVKSVSSFPPAFQAAYALGRGVSSLNRSLRIKSPVYYMNGLVGRPLEEFLQKGGFDVVVMPHLFPAETFTKLKNKGLPLPLTVAIGTDYTCIPFWEETDCDYYVLPHADCAADFERRGLPKEKLVPLGIPVPLAYSQREDKQAVRARLGLQEQGKYLLVMGGSMGAGKLPELVRAIQGECQRQSTEVTIFVVCGSNRRLFSALLEAFRGDPAVRVKSYLENIADYMKACDLLFTKPGGLTTTESAVTRIPTVLLEPISGCERANVEFFVSHGMALAPRGTQAQAQEGVALLRSPERRRAMLRAQEGCLSPRAAIDLVDFLERIVKKRAERMA